MPDPVLMANVRWLMRYRRARSARRPDVVDGLLELFAEPEPVRAGAERVGDPLLVLGTGELLAAEDFAVIGSPVRMPLPAASLLEMLPQEARQKAVVGGAHS
ncbi:hypothetical protein [Streptomyces niveus]|uniref:hypothetical protein n=1 Tax=Streptomyces niveus TaxID=193462 RepID=UPI0033A4B0E1